MLQVSNLSKAYGRQALFDDAGFTVDSGERVGLVGRNGHGKTTLFKILLGEEHADSGTVSMPSSYAVGHLSQHLHFTEGSVLKEACLGLRPSDDGRDETYRVKAVLRGLGFAEEDFGRAPLELSGGYQIRLNLAKVLVSEPHLLLLDEPTNYLDIVSIRWLAQFLRTWRRELILITHDREFMDSVTTHTMGIHRCRIRKVSGSTHKLYQQILMEEEVHERTRINEEKKRREVEQFINRFRAQATRARAVQSKVKALGKRERLEKLQEVRTLDFTFTAAPFTGKWLIEADDISFSFANGGPPLIAGLSASIGQDDRIAVIGKNGRGKTTLLRLLAGELAPLSGSVRCNPKLRLAYFGQSNIRQLNDRKTVEEEILDVLPEYSRTAARSICGAMMFEGDNALKKVQVLSGGERSRVLLGKILAAPANLLLLDEPTNHLDMESIDSLIEAIEAFDGAVVIVTHSEMILHAVASRLIVFDGGNAGVFEGTYRDFLERVGWKDEDSEEERNNSRKDEQAKGASRKEMKRIRAGLVNSRSRVLGALQAKIDDTESAIMDLEQQVEQDNRTLVEASARGDWEKIRDHSKSLQGAKERIDLLFDELAALTEEYRARSKEFEEQFGRLDEGLPIS